MIIITGNIITISHSPFVVIDMIIVIYYLITIKTNLSHSIIRKVVAWSLIPTLPKLSTSWIVHWELHIIQSLLH